jgi:hypothetical protein
MCCWIGAESRNLGNRKKILVMLDIAKPPTVDRRWAVQLRENGEVLDEQIDLTKDEAASVITRTLRTSSKLAQPKTRRA